jgi:hypothetical protein
LALADGPQRNFRAAILTEGGQMIPEARLVAEVQGSEPIRAVQLDDGMWFVAGAGEKTILHLQDPARGQTSIEVELPTGQAIVEIRWAEKTARAVVTSLPDPTPDGFRAMPAVSPAFPMMEGSREDCPPGSLFAQPPHGPDDSWSFGTSEVYVDGNVYLRAESFIDAGEICDIHWWGSQLVLIGSWYTCTDSNPVFEIKFYLDASGAPGAEVCSYTVTPTIVDTGILYAGFVPLLYYSVDLLEPCCNIAAGWVSIQGLGDTDCWFLWCSSGVGDGSSYFDNNGTPEPYLYDNSLCLTGEYVPIYGACCDDYTGICMDNVEQLDCPAGARFEPNVLCDNLDPPCGPLGACCSEDLVCLFTDVEAACDAVGGTWYEGEDCDAGFECPAACDHSIVLTDDYGDGWNGGTVDVLVNGNLVLDNLTIDYGYGPETYIFQAATGDTIETVYVAGGWSYENEYHIYDVNGFEICADGVGGNTPTGGYCGLGNCGGDPCEGLWPPNDDCVTATPVNAPYPQVVNGTNYCAQIDCPGVLDWHSTWWAIEMPYGMQKLDISFCGNGFEINHVGIVYYNDCTDCSAYILYDGIDWYSCPDGVTSPQITWMDIAGPGTVYFPVFFNYDSQVPYMIEIDVTEIVIPDNDLCEDAIPVAVPSETLGTTLGATLNDEDGFPYCGTSITTGGVWYSAIGTGTTMTASLCNDETNWDTKLSVYCPDCIDPLCVGGNDDYCGLQSQVSWCSQLGATYLILVHGYGGAQGEFQLDVYDDGASCSGAVACLPEGACCLLTGECIIATEMGCEAVDGEYQGDDTNCLGLPSPDATITVEILTDNYGSETTWDVVDENGVVVGSGGPLSSATFYSWDIPVLSCGCYVFTIYDSYGDGICCSYGYGYYNVYYNGVLVGTGGEFGYSESVTDIGDCTGCVGGLGACCVDHTCIVTTDFCCEFAGGLFLGAGSNCGTGMVPLFAEDFNAGIPDTWTITDDVGSGLMWNTNVYWGDPNWTGGDGMCAEADSDEFYTSDYDTSLISPSLDLSGAVGAMLDFDANYQHLSSDDYFEVYVSYDGGASWTNVLSWNEDHGTFHGTPGEHVTLAIAGGSADTKLRFRYVDLTPSWNWEVQFDNVMVSAEVIGLSPCQYLDIKPSSCPNPLNPKSRGVIPVALVGTPDFDVTQVDVATLRLARVDGVGGEVAPNFGPPGPVPTFEDVATPFYGDLCDCHEACGDGIVDLMMHFRRTSDVADALGLSTSPGGTYALYVKGNLLDGTPFVAPDCVVLVGNYWQQGGLMFGLPTP